MGNLRILADYLGAHLGASYCDDCLSTLASITNRHQVNQLAHRLERVGGGRAQGNVLLLLREVQEMHWKSGNCSPRGTATERSCGIG